MVDQSPTNSARRRVRTGCLTCRARRRKCDEAKPTCNNCKEKDLGCQYGVNITFVETKGSREPRNPRSAIQKYAKNRSRSEENLAADQTPVLRRQTSNSNESTFDFNSSIVEQSLSGNTSELSSENELNVLIYYQYNIAPALGLGIANSAFGIKALVHSSTSKNLLWAIISLASQHQAISHSRDRNASVSAHYAYKADSQLRSFEPIRSEDSLLSLTLLTWRQALVSDPDRWLSELPIFMARLPVADPILTLEQKLAFLRLWLAAILFSNERGDDVPWPPSLSLDMAGYEKNDLKGQLAIATMLLQNSLKAAVSEDGALSTTSPVSIWQRSWKDSQNWYSGRTDAMLPVLDMSSREGDLDSEVPFPTILFSNACAAVANVIHHVTAYILLSQKPRLSKVGAISSSSTSILWHVQRIVGIAASSSELGVSDPIVIASLMKVSGRLSHSSQREFVLKTLQNASPSSGLRLDGLISQFRTSS